MRKRGAVVAYGMAGGPPPPVDAGYLMETSKTLLGADLWDYLDGRASRLHRSARLFEALRTGSISLPKIETFPLHCGADAHRRIEDRSFAGKIVMIPNQSSDRKRGADS